jgi:hypothetical protein
MPPLLLMRSLDPAFTQEADYYAQTVLRIPSPLLETARTDILVQERHLLANDDASDDEAPLLSHPDLKPYAPQKPNTAHDPRIRTFSQPQYPDDTAPSSQGALDAFSLRPPTGILVGADGR